MKKVWIFVIAVGVISGLGLDQVMGQTVTVPVPGNVAWTDTGLVVQAGDHITITASGTIQYASDGSSSGPDGQPANGNGCLASFLVFCAVPNSLVGFIGSAPSLTLAGGFYVGSSFSGAATTSGKLFLGFNDGFVMTDRSGLDGGGVGDNSGSFTAKAAVGRSMGQFFGPALPTIVLTLTGCTSCTTGNTFSVQATVNNPSPIPVNVEVKAGVAFPDGTEASLWFANDKHFEVSLAAGVNSTVELLNVTVPLGLPTGQWVYEATLLSPETGRLLHRDWKSFTIH